MLINEGYLDLLIKREGRINNIRRKYISHKSEKKEHITTFLSFAKEIYYV
jgi:hypothetical protein